MQVGWDFSSVELNLENQLLNSSFQILSTNFDRKGVEFVSTAEHKRFPFYAIQWHAEKPILYGALLAFLTDSEWNAKQTTPHDMSTVIANRYIADYYISEGTSFLIMITFSSQKWQLFRQSQNGIHKLNLQFRLKSFVHKSNQRLRRVLCFQIAWDVLVYFRPLKP